MGLSRVCAGCGRLYGIRCNRCNPKTNINNHSDSKWKRLSQAKRAANPLCEICEKDGYVVPATEVHHIKPVCDYPDLKYEWTNLVSICRTCHQNEHKSGDKTSN